ncbi:dihydropteroate synthase [Desulfurivibrio alkaliphilus]|uniref:Dihydropteroate synthase n=1 Tax=Desulfurivibrio alkaliphilus (strain DSM 19089 / UNIQEM U267 / AHT2) TaxID=589865 RepID=D6Z232_DESAT|nr:dihydropteroate synthase [Desulfurivibrio alkaliphilus]ADH85607.1 dihydropteroate synthase [Desulfurivibrio alkaliphilus AHT 2]
MNPAAELPPVATFAGEGKNHRPRVMGILNVTPDSFSDGGKWSTEEAISRQAEQMLRDGADIIDIGGESTRPFAPAVTAEEELSRVLPAIRAVRRLHATIPISVDTTKAAVASEALAAGADIINDISALRFDPAMPALAAQGDWPVIIMHMQGTPADMQLNPHYQDVVAEIKTMLANRLAELAAAGIAKQRLIIDPGIGFGKTVAHNLEIIRRLQELRTLGQPILVGHSRKSFIGKVLDDLPVTERDLPSAVISALCVLKGADIIRVHDVKATAQAIKITLACQAPESCQYYSA